MRLASITQGISNAANSAKGTGTSKGGNANLYNQLNGYANKGVGKVAPDTGYDDGSGYYGNYYGGGYETDGGLDYEAYLEAARAARAEAIANANAALDRQGEVMKGKYKSQLDQVMQDYQKLRNDSEVNRYKAIKKLRETQANRGLLDSGAGRMENLRVSNNYNNALNEIGLQEANEKNEIQLALESVLAEIAMKKAQNEIAGLDDFNTVLQSMLSSGAGSYAYNPSASNYYAAAQNLASNKYNVMPQVNDANIAGSSTAAKLRALQEAQNAFKTGTSKGGNKNWLNIYGGE